MKFSRNLIALLTLVVLSFTLVWATPPGNPVAAPAVSKSSAVRVPLDVANPFRPVRVVFEIQSRTIDKWLNAPLFLQREDAVLVSDNFRTVYEYSFSPPYEVCVYPKDAARTESRRTGNLRLARTQPEIVRKA